MRVIFLNDCLGLNRPDRLYYDALSDAGLPSMDSISSNIKAPSLGDIGGSLGDKATGVNAGPSSAFSSYSNYIGGAGKPTNPFDTYQNLLTQNGIPQLQKTSESLQGNINNLQNSIYRATPNVTANTGNSLVTDSQRQGMIGAQTLPLMQLEEPLTSALGQVNNSISTQEQNIGNEVNAVGQNNQLLSNAGALGVSVAQDNAARQMTGFTQDAENMMNGLLKKMEIQGTLDSNEWQTLSTLAEQKQAHEQKLSEITAQNQADIKNTQVGNQFKILPAGNRLVNTFTGNTFKNP